MTQRTQNDGPEVLLGQVHAGSTRGTRPHIWRNLRTCRQSQPKNTAHSAPMHIKITQPHSSAHAQPSNPSKSPQQPVASNASSTYVVQFWVYTCEVVHLRCAPRCKKPADSNSNSFQRLVTFGQKSQHTSLPPIWHLLQKSSCSACTKHLKRFLKGI